MLTLSFSDLVAADTQICTVSPVLRPCVINTVRLHVGYSRLVKYRFKCVTINCMSSVTYIKSSHVKICKL